MRGGSKPFLLLLVFVAVAASAGRAQAPFVTDDVGVAEYHRVHFEFNDEYDVLQSSAYPNLRQNTANFKLSFGVLHNVEIGFDNQLLGIFNAQTSYLPRTAVGYGDLDLSLKWNFLKEQPKWWHPALAASLNIELPTGDDRRQLGSGIADYYLNFIAQKTVTEKTTVHANAGIYFAGNTLTGVEGIHTTSGFVYTTGVSVVRQFTPRLDLGVEGFGAFSGNVSLARQQLQTQIGGNYALRRKLSLDFGLIVGYDQASPRVGPILGFSIDF